MAAPLPLETQTLYAELLEQLVSVHSDRAVGRLEGGIVEKTVKGQVYLYWQASQPGGRTKQFYLGRRSQGAVDLVQGARTRAAG